MASSLSHLLRASNPPEKAHENELPRIDANRQEQHQHVSSAPPGLPPPQTLTLEFNHQHTPISAAPPPALIPPNASHASRPSPTPDDQSVVGTVGSLAPLGTIGSAPLTSVSPLPAASTTLQGGYTRPAPSRRSHANNTSLYQCADCQRRYSRPEHLARHIQTHTLGKRFGCEVCGKHFARADLLKRHTQNHQSNNKKRRKTDPSAGRVSHACTNCAKARVKCEEVKPCTRCRNRNINCEYASQEAGDAAALHLLHLSKSNQYQQQQQQTSLGASSVPTVSSVAPNDASLSQNLNQPLQDNRATPAKPQEAIIGYQYHTPPSHTPTSVSTPSHVNPPPTHVQSQAMPSPCQPQPYARIHDHIISQHHTSLPVHPTSIHQHSSASVRQQSHRDEAQLPTPDTPIEQNQDFSPASQHPPNENMIDPMRSQFSDFLRDVMFDQTMGPTRLVQGQGLAVLDFCDNTNLELSDVDFGLLDHWNVDGFVAGYLETTTTDESVDLSQIRQRVVKIWGESPWRWDPVRQDTAYQEQGNLAIPSGSQLTTGKNFDRVIDQKLESSSRDKILATVLGTVKNGANLQRIATSFPSTEIFDTLIHVFLASHLCSVSKFIHLSSFKLNQQWPEWLAMAAAAGAILTPVQTLRKLGYALQEAVRLTIPFKFEGNNTSIQNLSAVQAFVMVLDIGLWSGNRRKMEIAECHLMIPITMMRYRGKFQRSKYMANAVGPEDEGNVLEEKWKAWHERESWKRLVFHAYLRDAQTSMTTLTNPCMSYAELTLPLPEARELWFSATAEEWKSHYLQRSAGYPKRPPSLGDLIRDPSLLSQNYRRLDVQLSISIFLHGFWSLILEYRQLNAVQRTQLISNSLSGNPNLLLTSRHQELCKMLQSFQEMTAEWRADFSAQESLVLNLLFMNLHVSMDDVQLFSGKEGEEQARRLYPSLQRWAAAPEARHALWNAGQILRQAKMFPRGHLKDFYAVAVHHAALTLWTYGVITNAAKRRAPPSHYNRDELIRLDESDLQAVSRFITVGKARALIFGPVVDSGVSSPVEASVEDPQKCMTVVENILKANFGKKGAMLPAIVENLCHLIKQLGNAASSI